MKDLSERKGKTFKIKTSWIIGLSVALLLVVVISVRWITKSRQVRSQAQLAIAVEVSKPRLGPVQDILSLSGTISAQEEANAYSKVPGKLAGYVKAEGDVVAKDEILAWIERDEVGLQYSRAPVKAPIAGVVAQRFLDIGAAVAPAAGMPGTPILQVVNLKRLEVTVYIIERDLPRVREGQKVRVTVEAYPAEVFPGQITRIAPVVDLASRTTLVKIALPQPRHMLKPGMLANVEIILGEKPQALLVPRDAVLKQNQQAFVYLLQQGRAFRRDIIPGWLQGDWLEIQQGLSPDDQVVVQGQTRLTEGVQVQVIRSGE